MGTIRITEDLLKTLQNYEVIKEFNLQPFEGNEENFNQFKSVLMMLISGGKNELVSGLNTNEKETLHAQNLDMDSNNEERENCIRDSELKKETQMDTDLLLLPISQFSDLNTNEKETLHAQNLAMDSNEDRKNCIRDSELKKETQMDTDASDAKAAEKADLASQKVSKMDTNHEENEDSDIDVESLESAETSNEVQDSPKLVFRNNAEMQAHIERVNQINALKMIKRQQKDEKNVVEFCGHPYVDERNPLWSYFNTCARVDAVCINRYRNKNRYKVAVTRVTHGFDPVNRCTEGATTQNITKPERTPVCTDSFGEAVKQKINAMEQYLHMNDKARMCIFQNLKALEDRIMFLESIAPNIFPRPSSSTENGDPQNSGEPGPQPSMPDQNRIPRKSGPDQEVPQMRPAKKAK